MALSAFCGSGRSITRHISVLGWTGAKKIRQDQNVHGINWTRMHGVSIGLMTGSADNETMSAECQWLSAKHRSRRSPTVGGGQILRPIGVVVLGGYESTG